jgi:hypothetical protein
VASLGHEREYGHAHAVRRRSWFRLEKGYEACEPVMNLPIIEAYLGL